MMSSKPTRRAILETGALAAGTAALGPFVHTAHSAGKVTIAFWDHWVPGANEAMQKVIDDWGQANHVEVVLDFLESGTSDANLTPTLEKEARERQGHDLVQVWDWNAVRFRDSLAPVDDLVQALVADYGEMAENARYLAFHDGSWRAVAAPTGSHTYPMVSRLDLWREHAGIDLKAMFPAGGRDPQQAGQWTYAAFLEGAGKLHAAGHPFGNPISEASDSEMWLAPLLLAHGSEPMNADGDVTVASDGTRAALEYLAELAPLMPEEVYAWENVSNNRWLIDGQGSAIHNPPSAWAVAKEETPDVAAQLWHHDVPRGPKGHYRGADPAFFGIWSFAANASAARDLLRHLCQRDQVEQIVWGSQGFDVPLQAAFYDHEVWQKEGPPAGTLYNYPVQGDEVQVIPGYPAPPLLAEKISNEFLIAKMVAKVTRDGEAPADAIVWAEGELERLVRA